MLDGIVNELIVSTKLLNTNNVTRIASELGYQPLLVINALSEGNRLGKFVYHRKHDTIDPTEGLAIDKLAVSENMRELGEQLAVFVADMNSREQDIWIVRLTEFVPGTTELQIRLAVHSNADIAEYDLQDPRDKKSIYKFLTLTENLDKQWGAKQFIEPPKNKKSKKAARKADK